MTTHHVDVTSTHAVDRPGGRRWGLLALAVALALFLLYLLAPRLSLRKAGFYGTMVAALLFVATTWFAAGERREQHERDKAQAQASGRKPPAPLPAP